jgi:hypothetical protein
MNSQEPAVTNELHALSAKLKDLHKELLVFQTQIVQEEDARKYGPYDLLHMAIHDVRFAWIRELSELITQIDVHTSEQEEGEPYNPNVVVKQVAALLGGSRSDFSLGYQAALRAEPHLTMTEVEVKKAAARLHAFLNPV